MILDTLSLEMYSITGNTDERCPKRGNYNSSSLNELIIYKDDLQDELFGTKWIFY